jgi:hypothetical protein
MGIVMISIGCSESDVMQGVLAHDGPPKMMGRPKGCVAQNWLYSNDPDNLNPEGD